VRSTVAASASASRPSTPVNGLESAVTHVPSTTEKISIEPMPKNEEVKVDDKPNGDDNSNVQTGEPADATGNKTIEEVRSRSQSPPSDIFVDALSSKSEDVPATVELVEEKRAEEEDNKTIIDVPVPVPITVELKPAVVSGPDDSDKAKTNGINHSNDNHVNGLVEPDLKALALEEKGEDNRKETEETEETDRRQYVGDGTWEEKTWKELVRLREDMFWARVGGFRG
jgi:Rab guanine nucleotide exchange factor SEC2